MLRLDINLVFTVINLLVLYFFMRKFLFGRVNKILEERKALIEKQFADAKTAQDAADGMKTEYEGKLAAAQGEGEEIIARAKAEAKEMCIRDRARIPVSIGTETDFLSLIPGAAFSMGR